MLSMKCLRNEIDEVELVEGTNGKEVNIGKWSEMSHTRIPEFGGGGGIILVKKYL